MVWRVPVVPLPAALLAAIVLRRAGRPSGRRCGGGAVSARHGVVGWNRDKLVDDALMLSGIGKVGVQAEAAALAGRRIHATGIMIRRGELDMLPVGSLRAVGAAEPVPPPVVLGR